MSTYKLVCPHCRGPLRIRTSVGVHIFMRVAYIQCRTEGCSGSFRGEFVITHEMSPSGMPNPAIALPKADSAMRRATLCDADDDQLDIFDDQ